MNSFYLLKKTIIYTKKDGKPSFFVTCKNGIYIHNE